MKIYILEYLSEDFTKVYGYFSSKEKAEDCKKLLINNVDEDMKDYWNREITIYEVKVDEILIKEI